MEIKQSAKHEKSFNHKAAGDTMLFSQQKESASAPSLPSKKSQAMSLHKLF